MTTAFNPHSNGQSEKTNETVETILGCLILGQYESTWATLVPDVALFFALRRQAHRPDGREGALVAQTCIASCT